MTEISDLVEGSVPVELEGDKEIYVLFVTNYNTMTENLHGIYANSKSAKDTVAALVKMHPIFRNRETVPLLWEKIGDDSEQLNVAELDRNYRLTTFHVIN